MNGLSLLIAVVAFGQVPDASTGQSASPNIQFGWTLEKDNKFAYLIHVPPAAIDTMLTTGNELESNMPVELVGLVSRVVVRISEAPPERSHSLAELGEYQKQAARARQNTLPGNALATLSGKTPSPYAEIDRNRESEVQPLATPSTFQSPVTVQPPTFSSNQPNLPLNQPGAFGSQSNLTNFGNETRDRQLPSDPSSLGAFGQSQATAANSNNLNGNSFSVGPQTEAQQPVLSGGGLPPSTRNPSSFTNPALPSGNSNNSPFAKPNSLDTSFGPPSFASAPVGNQRGFGNPAVGSNANAGFDQDRVANPFPTNANDLRLADNRGVGSGVLQGSEQTRTALQQEQTKFSPGDLQASRTQDTLATANAQRDRLLPILFMLSFVANVYMAILMSKLVGRYRSLLASVRSGMPGFENPLAS